MSILDTLTLQEWEDFDKRTNMAINRAKHQDKLAQERIERALRIKQDDILRADRRSKGKGWKVRSQTDPNTVYFVTPTYQCNCLGYTYRNWCKHSDACKRRND